MAMEQLSQRENEVFELAAVGLSNDEIAARLDISRRTVETHLRTVFHKTGVSRRSQLAGLARDGIPPAAEPPQPRRQVGPPEDQPFWPQRRLRLYEAAVRRMIDRQIPLFEETVELTLVVGDRDGQDSVTERRRTVPKPYLVYRALRPIVAWTGGIATDPDDMAPTCDVHGQDIQPDISPIQDADGAPLMMVLFQPGLQGPTDWTLHYRAPRLWDPLRAGGTDTLTWATGTLDRRHRPSIDELRVNLVFPAGWTDVAFNEQGGLGTGRTERLLSGQTQVSWHDSGPVAAEYKWQLRGRPGS